MKDATFDQSREIFLSLSNDELSRALDGALFREDWDSVWIIVDELIERRVDL